MLVVIEIVMYGTLLKKVTINIYIQSHIHQKQIQLKCGSISETLSQTE